MTARAAKARDERGAIFVETVIALVPVLLMFALACQMIDFYVHELIAQRAAAAAVRAAVVVLPDAGVYYGDADDRLLDRFTGERKRAVEAAALAVLRASPSFQPHSLQLSVSGRGARGSTLGLTLAADYNCVLPNVRLLCGFDRKLTLRAEARLAYQGASYAYRRKV